MKIKRRGTHTRHFQKSFQCPTMAQLDPSDRMRIIIEGKKPEEQGNLSIRKLAIELSISRKAVALWWGRRDELGQIRALLPRWKGNSGRPVHKAFSTHEEKGKSIDLCEDLDIGEHQTDTARKLGCSLRTLRNHTHKTVNWRHRPWDDGQCIAGSSLSPLR